MLLTVKDVMVVPGHDLQYREGRAAVVAAVVSCIVQVTSSPCEVSHWGARKAAANEDACCMLPALHLMLPGAAPHQGCYHA